MNIDHDTALLWVNGGPEHRGGRIGGEHALIELEKIVRSRVGAVAGEVEVADRVGTKFWMKYKGFQHRLCRISLHLVGGYVDRDLLRIKTALAIGCLNLQLVALVGWVRVRFEEQHAVVINAKPIGICSAKDRKANNVA